MSPILFVRIALILMFILPGTLSLVLGITGAKWFMTSPGTSMARRHLGHFGARAFYVILGLLLIVCGVIGLVDPSKLMPAQ